MGRILLVGTTPDIAEGLKGAAQLEGATFESARGEADAIRRVRKESFDVVVTSPETTVDEDLALAGELRAVRPGVKIVLLTPAATPRQVIAALRARVFACYTAPFDTDEIAAMIAKAIAAEAWRDGIEVVTATPAWLTVRVACRRLTAERLVLFLGEMRRLDRPGAETERVMSAVREILLNAMEHGARFQPDLVVEVSAVRTARAIVYYVHDPGSGFRLDQIPHAAFANAPGDPMAHTDHREALGLRPGGFGLLIARKIVDEMIFNEKGNEVLLIKHTA